MRKEGSLLLLMLLLAGGFGIFLLLGRTEESVEMTGREEGAAPPVAVQETVPPLQESTHESRPPPESLPVEKDVHEEANQKILEGTVVDEDAKTPLPGAEISAWSGDNFDPDPGPQVLLAKGKTDGNGTFRISLAGEIEVVTIKVWARGYGVKVETAWPGDPVQIRLGREVRIRGMVLNPKKSPVPGAEVLLQKEFGVGSDGDALKEDLVRAREGMPVTGTLYVKADRNGLFEVEGADRRETYRVTGLDDRGCMGSVEVDTGGWEEGEELKPVECVVVIEPRWQLRLRVLLPDGRLHANAPAKLAGPRTSGFGELRSKAADGSYIFRHLVQGPYVLSVWASGFQPVTRKLDIQGNSDETIKLTPGLSITGKVMDEKGRPLKAQVVAVPVGGEPSRPLDTKQDGSFQIKDLPSGPVRIGAHTKGLCRGSVLARGGATDVKIVLRPFPVFFGTVDLAQAGAPVSHLLLHGVGSRDEKIPVDETGGFEKSWNSYQGGYAFMLVAEVPGWAPINLGTFKPKPGERIDLGVLSRPQSRNLACIVTGPDGAPVKGVGVILRFHRYSRQGRGQSDDKGHLALKNLPPWKGYLIASPPKGGPRFPRVVRFFSAVETGPVSIRFQLGGIVEGRVVYPSGDPVTHCAVHIHPMAEDGTVGECYGACSHVDQKGFFRSENVQPGRYRIVFYELGPEVFQGPEILVEAGKTLVVLVNAPALEEAK